MHKFIYFQTRLCIVFQNDAIGCNIHTFIQDGVVQGRLHVPRARGARIPLRTHIFSICSSTRLDFDLQSLSRKTMFSILVS